MARPQKVGVNYFPLDIDIDQDDKVAIIEAQHGIVGFGIVVKLLMHIYKNSYFYEWTEKEQILFSRRVNVDIKEVNVIINDCIKWGLFDEKLFKGFEILTSRGVQKRYFEITKRRQEVEVIKEYLLLDNVDINSYSNLVIVSINEDTENINVNINPQSKVKESKVKNNNIELQKDCNDNKSFQDTEEEDLKDNKDEYIFDEESTEIKLAKFMIDEMLRVKPDSKVPKNDVKSLQAWAQQIDYILRLDKRNQREVAELFRWAQQDTFWCSNIRSPRKLREKWDSLEIQMNNKKNKNPEEIESSNNYGW